MKRCPTCQRTFTDDAQKFCANDGTPLVNEETPAFDPEATVMSSSRIIDDEAAQTPPLPPTQYFAPGAGSQPEPGIHQSTPPQQQPGGAPSWPPAQQQQPPPYYPQSGMPGGQPQPPPWQGAQPQQQGWQPGQQPSQQPGQQPQGQNWGAGAGSYYPQPQQPGQYAPYGAASVTAAAAGGSSKAATAALICGIVSFVSMAAIIVIIGARIYDLRDILQPLFWLSIVTGVVGLALGIVGLIISKTTGSKVKAGIGLFISIIPLLLTLIGFANRP